MAQRLPFGRYKGRTPAEVPAGYLAWLANESDSPTWRARARDELARHGLSLEPADDTLAVGPPDPRPAAQVLPLLVFEWHQRMRALHRDDPAALAVIDAGLAVLRELSTAVTGRRHPTERELADARAELAAAECCDRPTEEYGR